MGVQNYWLCYQKWHSRSTNKSQVMQCIVMKCSSACLLSLTSKLKCSGVGSVSSLHTCPAITTTASLCFMLQSPDMAPLTYSPRLICPKTPRILEESMWPDLSKIKQIHLFNLTGSNSLLPPQRIGNQETTWMARSKKQFLACFSAPNHINWISVWQ